MAPGRLFNNKSLRADRTRRGAISVKGFEFSTLRRVPVRTAILDRLLYMPAFFVMYQKKRGLIYIYIYIYITKYF